MLKVYAAIGLLVATAVSCYAVGYQNGTGKAAKAQVKVAIEVIKDDNQDKLAITNHITETNKRKSEAVREIIETKIEYVAGECPVNKLGILSNQTYSAIPPGLFL